MRLILKATLLRRKAQGLAAAAFPLDEVERVLEPREQLCLFFFGGGSNNTPLPYGSGAISEDAKTKLPSKEQLSYCKAIIRFPLKEFCSPEQN